MNSQKEVQKVLWRWRSSAYIGATPCKVSLVQRKRQSLAVEKTMRAAKKEYAVYKADDLICIGTDEECAEHMGVLPATVRFYTTMAYRRRIEKRKNPRNYITVIDLDDEDE